MDHQLIYPSKKLLRTPTMPGHFVQITTKNQVLIQIVLLHSLIKTCSRKFNRAYPAIFLILQTTLHNNQHPRRESSKFSPIRMNLCYSLGHDRFHDIPLENMMSLCSTSFHSPKNSNDGKAIVIICKQLLHIKRFRTKEIPLGMNQMIIDGVGEIDLRILVTIKRVTSLIIGGQVNDLAINNVVLYHASFRKIKIFALNK